MAGGQGEGQSNRYDPLFSRFTNQPWIRSPRANWGIVPESERLRATPVLP
jgi:hypothetical protein